MKGIVFTLLNELVEESFGMEAWDTLLQKTELDGIYTAAGSYPDQQALSIVKALSEQSGLAADSLLRVFGEYMFSGFVSQYPTFFPKGIRAKELLMSVDGIIHVEVQKLFPDAVLPRFEYEDPAENQLIMRYHSQRKLCTLAEGLINRAAKYFDETIEHTQTKCMLHGDDHCRFELKFGGKNNDSH
jgi:hypothetical protein